MKLNTHLKVFSTLLFSVIFYFSDAQIVYQYASFNSGSGSLPGTSFNGTGGTSNSTSIPSFTYNISTPQANNLNNVVYNLNGTDEIAINGQAWEAKYGQINASTTSCLKVTIASVGVNNSNPGDPLLTPITTVINFNSPTNNKHWGFMVLDVDVDQCDIIAKAPNGTTYSKAEVSSWFKGVFDGNTGDGYASSTPCFDATNATLVASRFKTAPCTRITTLSSPTDDMGAYAYFEPDVPVKEIRFVLYDLQSKQSTQGPSQRYFFAGARTNKISGNVYNDINGTTDNMVNGTGIGVADGNQLWAYLVNSSGVIEDSTAVLSNGSYAFDYVLYTSAATNYDVVLSVNQYAIGALNPSVSLVSGWASTSEKWGTTTGNDGTTNGKISITSSTTDVTNVNFGIQKLPESSFNVQDPQPNPGGTNFVTVPSNAFFLNNVGSTPNTIDYNGGTVSQIRITSFPSNTTSININGTVYNSASWPGVGVLVTFSNNSGISQALSVDPSGTTGAASDIVINFASIDNAGFQDPTPGSVTLSFSSLLSVKFINFNATKNINQTNITFQVSESAAESYFEIEHSTNAVNFSSIKKLKGEINTVYNFTDINPMLNAQNYYRVKLIDAKGAISYSTIARVSFNTKVKISIAPNPTQSKVTLTLSDEVVGKQINIKLINYNGQSIVNIPAHKAQFTETIDFSLIKNGTYFVQILNNAGEILHQEKIVVIK
jgi:hypothetical protein